VTAAVPVAERDPLAGLPRRRLGRWSFFGVGSHRDPFSGFTSGKRLLAVVLVGAVVLAAGAVLGVRALLSTPTVTYTANFTEAPGVYVGNHVDVLGIPVGSVTAIAPHTTYVAVTLQVDRGVKIPAKAVAALMAPQLVNDRYIQLTPAYRSGPVLGDGAIIPMNHTALPESVDQIISTLDQLIQALGPNGVNKNGALSRFVHDVARTVGKNGPSFHTTVTALGQALSALSNDGPSITTILDNVGSFTSEAAQNTKEFQTFANDLAGVTSVVAADRADLGTTLSQLQQVMTQVTTFVHNNQAALGPTLQNLETFASEVLTQQQALGEAFTEGGLALQNLNQAIVTLPDGSTALRIRYDPSLDTPGFVSSLCGQELPRILNLGLEQAKSSELNLACAASSALGTITPPPNAPQGPDMSLNALVGS
jgi:phospholipid/cholesterol/gamma-HCH transport system substrate-binding protein